MSGHNEDSLDKSDLRRIRALTIELLTQYDQSGSSMRELLRTFRRGRHIGQQKTGMVDALCLGVVRFLNTIDFLIARCLRRVPLNRMAMRERCALRLAVFEVCWRHRGHRQVSREYLADYPAAKDALECIEKSSLEEFIIDLPVVERLSVEYAHPSFLVEVLTNQLGVPSAIQLMEANNKPPVNYVRSNHLLDSTQAGIHELIGEGVSLKEDGSFEGVYRLADPVNRVIQSEAYRSGHVLLQDKSSVFAVYALSPQPGDTTWDACAAPGMKTQLIWDQMKEVGRLIASDVNATRLRVSQRRAQRLGYSGVAFLRADATRPVVSKAERILVDAPCTSTGILASNPSFKWRLNKKTLFDLMAVQNKILDGILAAYANRPGTEIVYSTCSLLPHEGESQIDSALKSHPIELVELPDIGERGYSGFRCTASVRRFFPHLHDCNGFFVAKMRISR
ncbi:hypothetical protein EU545_01425 [Candidatus Thorarchaeota archaeon]|nr:MAG: hypothetical protein EU545_01425 [Candidatus Thorarchaeota archaeon]